MAYTPIAMVDRTGFGWESQAVTAPDGITTIVWRVDRSEVSPGGLFGRRVDPSGRPLGAAFQVNDPDIGVSQPSLDVDAQGNVLVMWTNSPRHDTEYSRLFYQRFDAQGRRVGGNEMLLNEPLASLESMLHARQDGGFAILTSSAQSDAYLYLRFDAAGELVAGNEMRRDDLATPGWDVAYTDAYPISAPNGDGLVLVWSEFRGRGLPGGGYLSDGRVWARRLGANGAPIGEDVLVASVEGSTDGSAGILLQPSVSPLAGGGFLVAWDERATGGGSSYTIRRGRIYDASGSPIGDLITLSPEAGENRDVRTTQLADGSIAAFTVTHTHSNPDILRYQLFSATGEALAAPVRVDEYPSYSTYASNVVATPGGFLFVWQAPINNDDSEIKILAFGDEAQALDAPALLLADRAGGLRAWGNHVALPISDWDAENAVIAPDGRVYVDFGDRGLWVRKGEDLVQVNAANPEGLIVGSDGALYVDYGSFGLWRGDASGLKRLNGANPDGFVATPDGTLYVDFGTFGLWRRTADGKFGQINGANPEGFAATPGGVLFVDYGRFGLWRADASGFVQLNQANPDSLAASPDGSVFVDFGTFGLWRWNGGMERINGADAEAMAVTADGVLHIDFGSFGLWEWSTTAGLALRNADDPTALAAGRDGSLYVVFGPAGVWRLLSSGQFQLVDPSRPRRIFV